MADAATGRIAIGIATYRRPDLLRQLLASLADVQFAGQMNVYVVDNDAEGSGREIAANFGELVTSYVIESEAGIAQARNRFLEIIADEEFVVFVDDDEWVEQDWLSRLAETMDAFQVEVVAGPVLPVFPVDAPDWAVNGGFYERQRHSTGTQLTLAATNNVLVRRDALERLESPRFDTNFSLTGGSDSDLFNRMVQAGAAIVWCDEAIVSETVPHDRMTWQWVRRRAERTGNVRARLLLQDGRRLRVVVEGVGRMLTGGVKVALRHLRRQPQTATSLNTWERGKGMLRALRGNLVDEYRRP